MLHVLCLELDILYGDSDWSCSVLLFLYDQLAMYPAAQSYSDMERGQLLCTRLRCARLCRRTRMTHHAYELFFALKHFTIVFCRNLLKKWLHFIHNQESINLMPVFPLKESRKVDHFLELLKRWSDFNHNQESINLNASVSFRRLERKVDHFVELVSC